MSTAPIPSRNREYSGDRNMEEFWKELRPRREPTQKRFFLPIVLALLVVSIPWYRSTGVMGSLVGGLPIWIWVALGCSAAISVVTAVVALFYWDDDVD